MRILQLDMNGFDAAREALIGILLDAVGNGASIGFLSDLSHSEAAAYWIDVRAAVAGGTRLLWGAEQDGKIVGTVQLDLCQRKNGVNRAEVQKLLVHSHARRAGIASMLMQELETAARALERGLLYLDTEAGSSAEPFYRTLGYSFIGGLPEYACSPDGVWTSNAIYYKTLFSRSAT